MNGKLWFRLFLTGFMLTTLVLTGCDDGSDGDPGVAGAAGTAGLSAYDIAVKNGFVGTEQQWLASLGSAAATTADPEQCAVCHNDVEVLHAATGVPVISNASGALVAGNYVITFDLEVDGVGTNAGYDLYRAYVTNSDPTLDDADPLTTPATTTNVRTTLVNRADPTVALPAGFTVSSTAAGAFTVTIPAASVLDNAAYTVILRDVATATTWGTLEPGFVVALNAAPLRALVSDDGVSVGCASCHGASASSLFDHYRVKGNECQACHAIFSRSADTYTKDSLGVWVNQGSLPGSNFTEYIHGIHNSHNMPSDQTYYRSATTQWSVGYPSAMNNCRTCHATDAQLAAAAGAQVSFYLCMSCHQTWDGFVDHDGNQLIGAADFHRGLAAAAAGGNPMNINCNSCHSLSETFNEAGDFHNFLTVDLANPDVHYNQFYMGEDISFANPNDVQFKIDSVVSDGSNVSFTWSATKGAPPVAVDPCNTNIATGPLFNYPSSSGVAGAGGIGAYLAYAKGDDWVNEFIDSAPGQPARARNLFTSLTTTCAANVATTTGLVLDADAGYASKVLLALGGKPIDQDTFDIGGTNLDKPFFVRVASPTYAFNPADGSVAAARRDAVDNAKCLGCHQGTLYQHGGDRVDNEQLCVVCHNPASSDKNNRLDLYQIVNADGTVNTDVTYDGKNSESYDMRTMLHAIHGVEQRLVTGGKPWTIYRGRGIYAFAMADTALPVGWPADYADGAKKAIAGSTNASTQTHNWIVVHYPKPASDCDACHNNGQYEAADQTKAVGVTVDAGYDWPGQSDDTIIGPTAAACTACHAGASQRSHAQSNGYKANVTKDEMLEKAQ